MWSRRYFAPRYFAPRYFAESQGTEPEVPEAPSETGRPRSRRLVAIRAARALLLLLGGV